MAGWIVPPPAPPAKSREDFERERAAKVRWLAREGLLKSERLKAALMKVHREGFIGDGYRDYAYEEAPLPLPGVQATISCPHSYPLFYEPLGLDRGHRFLEVGAGSGYGAAIAREVVGPDGLVVSIEIDPLTFEFARFNLRNAGYEDIVLVLGDGSLGYPPLAPYDRVAVTAACADIPAPLIDQLRDGGRLISPVQAGEGQNLVLLEKADGRVRRRVITKVLYVPLRGTYGRLERTLPA